MPKRKKGHTTPHVCVPITHSRRNIPSEHDKKAIFRLQRSVLDSFYTEIQRPVFLSVRPEAKLDMFNNFDLDKQFDLYLDLPSAEDPQLCRIILEGKNMEPKPWILPTPQTNNDATTLGTAAAASNFTPALEKAAEQLKNNMYNNTLDGVSAYVQQPVCNSPVQPIDQHDANAENHTQLLYNAHFNDILTEYPAWSTDTNDIENTNEAQ